MTRPQRERPLLAHLTTTDMSLDWLLGPQLEAFVAHGYDVVGISAPGTHVAALRARGIDHVAVDSLTRAASPIDDLRALRDLTRVLRDVRPDILHTHNPKPGVLGRVVGRLTGVPLIVNTQHGLYAQPTDRRRKRWPVYAVERIAAAFGDVELVQNPEDVDTLVRRLRVPSAKVHLLGNGIDLTRFAPHADTTAMRRSIRESWGVGGDEIVVGAVGRLVREKGIDTIVAVAERLRRTDPAVRFVVVGPDDVVKGDAIGNTLRTAAASAGVVLAGRRDDMPDCYAAMDVFVTASLREGFPRAAMEAAAMGLPTVATDIRGNRQVVDHGVTGLLVAVGDTDAMLAALSELVGDSERRSVMGAAAACRAVEHFDQAQVIARTLAVYRSTGNSAMVTPPA